MVKVIPKFLIAVLVILALILVWFYREQWQANKAAARYRLANRLVLVLDRGGEVWWINPETFVKIPVHTKATTWEAGYKNLQAQAKNSCAPAAADILWQCQQTLFWRALNQTHQIMNEKMLRDLAQKYGYGIDQKTLDDIPN